MITFSDFKKVISLLESTDKKAVFCFGRMNPPTKGHHEMMQDIVDIAEMKNASALLFLSHSQDKKKNPLDYDFKYYLIKKYAPKGLNVVKSDARTIFDAVKHIVKMGARDLIIVGGEDREADFRKLSKYKADLKINSIDVHIGKRTEGVSGTQLRQYAIDGDYDNYKKVAISGDSEDTRMTFNKIREVMVGK